MKIRRKVEPEKWPLPGLSMGPDHNQVDLTQLIHCPEFVPRQTPAEQTGIAATPTVEQIFTRSDIDCPF